MIFRMRFSGDDYLHRHVRIGQDSFQPIHVAEKKCRALVGREPAREADRERAGIEDFIETANFGGTSLAVDGELHHPLTHECDQTALAAAVRLPKFLIRNVLDQIPGLASG